MNLQESLASLDHTKDDHWTADNQPLMTKLYELVGNEEFTRQDVIKLDPQYNRISVAAKAAQAKQAAAEAVLAGTDTKPAQNAGDEHGLTESAQERVKNVAVPVGGDESAAEAQSPEVAAAEAAGLPDPSVEPATEPDIPDPFEASEPAEDGASEGDSESANEPATDEGDSNVPAPEASAPSTEAGSEAPEASSEEVAGPSPAPEAVEPNVGAAPEPNVATAPLAETKVAGATPVYPTPVYEPHPLPVNPHQSKLDALNAELEDATKDMQAKQAAETQAKKDATAASNVVNGINRKIDLLNRQDPHRQARAIRLYLNQSNANRAARAARMNSFTSQVGVDPAEAAKKLNPKSPLDQALSGRKNPVPLKRGA